MNLTKFAGKHGSVTTISYRELKKTKRVFSGYEILDGAFPLFLQQLSFAKHRWPDGLSRIWMEEKLQSRSGIQRLTLAGEELQYLGCVVACRGQVLLAVTLTWAQRQLLQVLQDTRQPRAASKISPVLTQSNCTQEEKLKRCLTRKEVTLSA